MLATRTAPGTDPKIPSYAGGKFPLSTFLAERVRGILADPFEWDRLPPQLAELAPAAAPPLGRAGARATSWSRRSRAAAAITSICFPFEGRLAHQTLGMLLTRRLERARPASRSASSPTTTASRSGRWAT